MVVENNKKVVLAVQRTPPRPMQDGISSYTTALAAPVYIIMFARIIGKCFVIIYSCVSRCGVGITFLRRFYYSRWAGSGGGW